MTILSDSNREPAPKIDALEFDGPRSRRHNGATSSGASGFSGDSIVFGDDASLLEGVVDGIIERDRLQMQREVRRYLSYISAVLNALCAGSITAFSLYGHMFVSRLHYSLYNLNAISIAGELAMYLPVPIFGYFVDRYSPRPVAFVSALFFATGYFLAAFTYRAGPKDGGGWPFGVMMVAFVFIGMGTSSMYLAAVTTCAKNFGKSKYKGIALAMPIAAFGLSGMWQSQIGSRLLYEVKKDGSKGNVNVFKYFIFLGCTLLAVGLIGSLLQNIVNEDELIEEAVEGLERSGLLGADAPWSPRQDTLFDAASNGRRYGTIDSDDENDDAMDEVEDLTASLLKIREEGRKKKLWLLNAETRYFLSDHTMWLLAVGFFLVTGPVETFINNLGTMLTALYPSEADIPSTNSPATNVSVLALASTLARVIAGILSDMISPSSTDSSTHAQYSALTPSASTQGLRNPFDSLPRRRCSISRLTLLIFTGGLLTIGYLLLISPLTTQHPATFVAVSGILGTVNGAAFALVPLLISAVWGVQNFGTNWGIVAMMPALGATFWSALYSVGYQSHVDADTGICFGYECYAGVGAGMAGAGIAAVVAWTWIGWGRGGWWSRGVVV